MARFPEFLQTSLRALRRRLLLSATVAIPVAGVILLCDGVRHAAPAASGVAGSIERPVPATASQIPPVAGQSMELSAIAQLGLSPTTNSRL